jgi:hypothetical protein
VGDPLPYEPEEESELPAKPPVKPPPISRADWLVGAEDGLTAELDRLDGGNSLPVERPKLVRPAPREDEGSSPPGSARVIPFPGHATQRPLTPPPPPPSPSPRMPRWDASPNSVPMLRREGEAAFRPASSIPELGRDFPMDDAEERARVSAHAAELRAQEHAIASRPHTVVSPTDFDLPSAEPAWWTQLPGMLANDRRVQAGVVGLVLLLAVMTFWPREERTISVAHLKEHAARYADAQVRVSGRVDEVFPVGGSWAFTLLQGRDTIVVFTRTREPRRDEKLIVVGTLSTGFLDGVSRAAIFESTR